MNNTIKLLLIFITTQILFGCSATRFISSIFHEEVVFFFASSDYPDEAKKQPNTPARRATLVFGPYMPNLGRAGGGFGGNYHSYKGAMEGEEIVALWQVPVKDKVLRYYVRSEPGKGIIRAPREGHYSYSVGVAFGPMRVRPTGLTKEQHITAEIAHRNVNNRPTYYRWGEWDKLYYVTGIFSGSDLQEKPRKFHEIQGIAITAEQYDKLYERCHGGWKTVRCFMDESFPNLTPEQLAYIQSRKHPDDDYRLSGQHPIPKRRINRYN
jgi:hypothetical protein